MATNIEDVLAAICTQSKLFHTNDFQNVYALGSAEEAKLAYDVLVAYGFDVKVYHQVGKMSKLYLTHPTAPEDQLDKIYSSAKAYATALKQIKQNLDQLCQTPELHSMGYSMTFANYQAGAKQIQIHISPVVASIANDAQEEPPLVYTPAAPLMANDQPPVMKQAVKKARQDDITAGPEVGKGKYPGRKLAAEGVAKERSPMRKLGLWAYGHMSASSYSMFIQAMLAGLVMALFVLFKGYMCADFAVANKNRSWYCSYNDATEQLKQQQQEEHDRRARQFGLPPTTTN